MDKNTVVTDAGEKLTKVNNKDITKHIDSITKIDDRRIQMGGIQRAPASVKIELTARCNLKCKYCATSMRQCEPPPDMDIKFFEKIVTDMRICGVEEIGLFYLGEPLMNPNLLYEALDIVKNELKFPYVFLTSNATLAVPSVVKQLFKLGLDSLKWSVNFADEKQFSDITQCRENLFKKAIENIQEAWKIRNWDNYSTILSASSILYDGEQKQKMDDFLKKEIIPFVDRHYWLPLYQMAMYKDQVIKQLGYIPTAGNMGRIDDVTMLPTRNPLPCWSAFTEGHVRADGGFSACCFGSDEKFDMGILDGNNFMKVWNSKKYQRLREAQINTLTVGQKALQGTPCEVCVAYE